MTSRIESKDRTDDIADQRFQEQKAQLHEYMKNHPDKEQWVKKYMLKRLLELWEKEDLGWRQIVVQDVDHISKIYDWNLAIKVDVYQDYQSEVLFALKNDLFQSLNITEKRAIATTFGDLEKTVIINEVKYKRNFSEDSWNDYFEKKNIPTEGYWQDIVQQYLVMNKIAKILYGKKYNDVFGLHTDPQKVHRIQPSTQLKLLFEE